MTFSVQDYSMMGRALKLAAKARYTTAPNPAVGCVVVADNKIIGEGFTRPAGAITQKLKHYRWRVRPLTAHCM